MSDLARFIRDIPDFPEPGIVFKDVTPLFADAEAVIRGPEGAVLRWLWRRTGNPSIELDGNRAAAGKLHNLLGVATQ